MGFLADDLLVKQPMSDDLANRPASIVPGCVTYLSEPRSARYFRINLEGCKTPEEIEFIVRPPMAKTRIGGD